VADLAKLVVRLEAQSAQLTTELEKANGKLARFERNATGSLDKLNKRFDKFGFGVKSALAGLFAGISFRALIQANVEASEAFGLLENAVERAGDAAGGRSAQDFAKVATQIQNVTTVTDEAVQGVQQLLLRFQNIRTDRFDDATSAVVDFAAATKRDLESAGELIGKALSDPVKGMTALAKAGVIFSDGQKKVIENLVETGRRAEAQGLIIDALGSRFGGAAEKMRNNFGGALKAVNIALGDLLESEGGLPAATEAMNDLAKTLQDPAVKAGADALFSTLITGASKATNFLAKTAAGIDVILSKGNTRLEQLEKQIAFLEEQRDSFLPAIANFGGRGDIFPEGGLDALIGRSNIQKKIDELKGEMEEILGLGVRGAEVARQVKDTFDAVNGAFELPDIEVVDNTQALADAAEKLQKQLEAQGKSLTEQLLTPLEKYNARVAEADKLLAANTITQDTWARALGAARAELNGVSEGILEVSERYKTLEEQLEENIFEDVKETNDEWIEQMGEDLTKEFDEVLKNSEKAWTVFSDQAARNTQDILADGIYNGVTEGFDDGTKGMLDSFFEMLKKMAAQAIAADIAGKIFGTDENGNPGGGGGLLGKILGWLGGNGNATTDSGAGLAQGASSWLSKIGGFFSGGGGGGGWLSAIASIFGSMDQGGHGAAGEPVVIGRGAQPELFVPDTAGEFYPKGMYGGQRNEINFFLQAPNGRVSLETQQQVATRTQHALAMASRRNG
jgi:hypothetical protein